MRFCENMIKLIIFKIKKVNYIYWHTDGSNRPRTLPNKKKKYKINTVIVIKIIQMLRKMKTKHLNFIL